MKKIIFLFLIFFVLFSFLITNFLLAQERKLEVEYPEIFGIKPETLKEGLPKYFKYIFNFAIIISGILIFLVLIKEGLVYLTSLGQPLKMKEAKRRIGAAFLGILLLLFSYLFLATINPQLLFFSLPHLKPFEPKEPREPPTFEPEETSLIGAELALGQGLEEGVLKEENLERIKNTLANLESYLKKEINTQPSFQRISDVNKYLQTLTEDCRCENLDAICTKPKNGAFPIGCVGEDICEEETREKINKILKINEEKIKKLSFFQERIIYFAKKDPLTEELSKYQEIEQEILACQNQGGGILTLNQYLEQKEELKKQGYQVVKIPSDLPIEANPLTFYCLVGGTYFDSFYFPQEYFFEEISLEPERKKLSCPLEFEIGEVLDQGRELAILMVVKMERLADLIEKMKNKINKINELVSQYNKQNCEISCACVPNPCYQVCCVPPFCGFCYVGNCQALCIMSIGGCYEETPFPREELKEKIKELKELEEEIFSTLREIDNLFLEIDFLLVSPENPKNLQNLKTSFSLCESKTGETNWLLKTCKEVKGNLGPEGQIIVDCHPRNFYCCISEEIPSLASKKYYFLAAKKFELLPTEDNCPQGWLCDEKVKFYNQYEEASEELKEFLACLREKLDRVEKTYNLKEKLGKISAISDPKIKQGLCSWEGGPEGERGECSFTYEIKKGKERVSAHYGGIFCRFERKSFAVDLSLEKDYEKKYAQEIIEKIKECDPGAYISYRTSENYPYLHISLTKGYQCGGI